MENRANAILRFVEDQLRRFLQWMGLQNERATMVSEHSPRFEVETVAGVPELEQFSSRLPLHLDRYWFAYSNEYSHTFEFRAIRRADGRYDVLILKRHEYGHRSAGGHDTHRHDIGGSNERICFNPDDPEASPKDLPDACRKAVFWADCTSQYIMYGTRF